MTTKLDIIFAREGDLISGLLPLFDEEPTQVTGLVISRCGDFTLEVLWDNGTLTYFCICDKCENAEDPLVNDENRVKIIQRVNEDDLQGSKRPPPRKILSHPWRSGPA